MPFPTRSLTAPSPLPSRRALALALLFAAATATAASAQNLLANPDFDTGIAGWTPFRGTASWDAATDLDDCLGSGALVGGNPGSFDGAFRIELRDMGTCVEVNPGELWFLTVNLLPDVVASTELGFIAYTDATCTNGATYAPIAGYGPLTHQWLQFQLGATIQAGIDSLRADFRFADPAISSYQMVIDRVFLGRDQVLLIDDFEAAGTCRWSSVAP